MSSEKDKPQGSSSDDSEGLINGHDCPHCGIWFRLDEAKPVGKDALRCPNCGWVIEKGPL